jgi:hypothetical protein
MALCAQPRGEPYSARCKQRLSDGSPLARANLGVPAPESRQQRADQGKADAKPRQCNPVSRLRTHTLCSAACRDGMAEWAGEGGGRFGERSEDEAPTLPRLSHPAPAARRGTPTHTSAEKRQSGHHKTPSRSPNVPHPRPPKRQPQNTCLVKMSVAICRCGQRCAKRQLTIMDTVCSAPHPTP